MGLANKQWLGGHPLRYRSHRKTRVRITSTQVLRHQRENGVQAILRFERTKGDYQSLVIETDDGSELAKAVAGSDAATRRRVVAEVLKRDGVEVLSEVLVGYVQELAGDLQKKAALRVLTEHYANKRERTSKKGPVLMS